jgi:hypothetical protein
MSESLRERWRALEASHSYGLVLALVVLVVVLEIALPEGDTARLAMVVLLGATLLVAVWTSQAPTRLLHVAGIFVAAAIVAALLAAVAPWDTANATRALNILLVAVVPVVLIRGMVSAVRSGGVTLQVVLGVLAIYILGAQGFAVVYAILGSLDGPESFFAGQSGPFSISDYLYFSFTTQTTVGYGDFTPAGQVGRAVASLQAVAGQLYLVSVVAVVVGNLGRGTARQEARVREIARQIAEEQAAAGGASPPGPGAPPPG